MRTCTTWFYLLSIIPVFNFAVSVTLFLSFSSPLPFSTAELFQDLQIPIQRSMFLQDEQLSVVDQQLPEDADIEEERVRQSEYINMNVVVLHEMLRKLDCDGASGPIAADGTQLTAASLPPEIVDALLHYLTQQEEEVQQLHARARLCEEQRIRDTDRAGALGEKIEKLKNTVAAMSAKSSADMREFHLHLQQNANAAKQRQRELVDLTRKREKLELEVKRTQMEAERLRKIAKRVK
jgi:small-conductance mechanosensitive channel